MLGIALYKATQQVSKLVFPFLVLSTFDNFSLFFSQIIIILQLIKSKCMPAVLYGLEACPLKSPIYIL